jgi:hypothetical protein
MPRRSTTEESTTFTKIPHLHKASPDDIEHRDFPTKASEHREKFEEAFRRIKWMPSGSQHGAIVEGKRDGKRAAELQFDERFRGKKRSREQGMEASESKAGQRTWILKDGKWVKESAGGELQNQNAAIVQTARPVNDAAP